MGAGRLNALIWAAEKIFPELLRGALLQRRKAHGSYPGSTCCLAMTQMGCI